MIRPSIPKKNLSQNRWYSYNLYNVKLKTRSHCFRSLKVIYSLYKIKAHSWPIQIRFIKAKFTKWKKSLLRASKKSLKETISSANNRMTISN